MKQFIVFIALVIVFTSLGVTSTDLARYKQVNIALKALAEEIACGGGLMTNGSESSESLAIDYDEADVYAKFITSKAESTPIFSAGQLTYQITSDSGIESRKIMVTMSYELEGKPPISRKATYEWLKQNGK